MIHVQITPAGVGEVAVEAPTDHAEDIDLAVWPLVREALDRLDRRLRLEGPALLARLRSKEGLPA
jgi:hypothetical protein